MNIEKEGELFEQWWEDEGQYHRAGGDDYCKTFAWEAWIFVKNQVIPDGFVLVPKEPTQKMIGKFPEVSYQDTYLGECSLWVDDETICSGYKAMIEARESANG